METSETSQRWSQPLDLAELGELTAQWLEGSASSPWYGGSPPDSETAPLVPFLAAMNRRGYVTDWLPAGDTKRRAGTTGHGYGLLRRSSGASALHRSRSAADLVVIVHYPGVDADYQLPITRDGVRTDTADAWRTTSLWTGIHPGHGDDAVRMLLRGNL